MRIQHRAARHLGAVLFALSVAGVALPTGLIAQEPTSGEPQDTQVTGEGLTVEKAEMVTYVGLQLVIDSLQEAAIQEMVRIHSESGRAQIRANLTEGIAAAQEERGMTPERYKTVTFLISSDADVRALYDATMAEAREGEGDGAGGI